MGSHVHCIMCGKLPPDGTVSVGVTVPVKDYRNVALETPGAYFLCRGCRQAVAIAEKEAKRQRRDQKVVAETVPRVCPQHGLDPCDCELGHDTPVPN